jgi:hypothetical protein
MNSNAYEMGRTVGMVIGFLLVIGFPVLAVVSIILACVKRTAGWVVAACIFSLMAMVMGGFFAVGVYNGFQRASKGQSVTKRVTSDDGWISLEVPSSWSNLPEIGKDSPLKMGNKFAEQYLMVFTDPRVDFRGTLPEFSKLTTGRMVTKLQDASASEPQSLTINGFPALRVRVEGTAGSVHVCYHHTSVETPDGMHQILQWTLASREAKAFPVFEKVAESFQVVKAPSRGGSAGEGPVVDKQ